MSDKNNEGQTGLQFYIPTGIHYDFKMACLVNRKSIREVILTLVYQYIKDNKGGQHAVSTKVKRTG